MWQTSQSTSHDLAALVSSTETCGAFFAHFSPDTASVITNEMILTDVLFTLPSRWDLPVYCNVTHEEDAGVHVEIEGRGSDGAVDPVDGNRVCGVVSYSNGQTEAEEEVRGG